MLEMMDLNANLWLKPKPTEKSNIFCKPSGREKRCNDELNKIHRILSERVSVAVVLDAETRKSLCDIRSELKALRRQIGKEN